MKYRSSAAPYQRAQEQIKLKKAVNRSNGLFEMTLRVDKEAILDERLLRIVIRGTIFSQTERSTLRA